MKVAEVTDHPEADIEDDEDYGNVMKECRLFREEIFWRDLYFWLREKGYALRTRYHPEWVASWKDTKESWLDCEDGQTAQVM